MLQTGASDGVSLFIVKKKKLEWLLSSSQDDVESKHSRVSYRRRRGAGHWDSLPTKEGGKGN